MAGRAAAAAGLGRSPRSASRAGCCLCRPRLQVLSKNPGFCLSLVKDYVTRQLQADSRSIHGDQEEASRLKAAIEDTRQQVGRGSFMGRGA